MVTITLEDKELAELINLANHRANRLKRDVRRVDLSNEPNSKNYRRHLQREYEQAYHLAQKLTMYYQNRDQAPPES